ncbi:MAG: KH domain-containing protein [Armatimonadota bacterium]|nr:KH domain-containing protein [Armatimonadota bacterium]MDR7439885.1 KH domain-containing protein [Armatimonadota bacterium]MDR7563320.1 KH domain-containing protein [Armatimonadota bacterium]MDR7567474.1 KH domain-containing protein [Armatimonadota bacterium]MDR7601977.1 KH domain-containing protein [Armatimonadota bacterium]
MTTAHATPSGGDVRGLVEYVVRGLVDHPEAVRVEEEEHVVRVHVAPEDRGKVIGRNGRVIQALRTLARVAARGTGTVQVEIAEESRP